MSLAEPVWRQWHDEAEPIRVGVSACLLGAEVRFDGGHKRDRYLTDVRRACSSTGVDYVQLNTSDPLDAALAGYLAFRQKTIRSTGRR